MEVLNSLWWKGFIEQQSLKLGLKTDDVTDCDNGECYNVIYLEWSEQVEFDGMKQEMDCREWMTYDKDWLVTCDEDVEGKKSQQHTR